MRILHTSDWHLGRSLYPEMRPMLLISGVAGR